MHKHRPKPIDGIFVTPGLLGHPCGYVGGLDAIASDHQCFWLDISESWVFSDTSPLIMTTKAWCLKSDKPQTTMPYLKHSKTTARLTTCSTRLGNFQ